MGTVRETGSGNAFSEWKRAKEYRQWAEAESGEAARQMDEHERKRDGSCPWDDGFPRLHEEILGCRIW